MQDVLNSFSHQSLMFLFCFRKDPKYLPYLQNEKFREDTNTLKSKYNYQKYVTTLDYIILSFPKVIKYIRLNNKYFIQSYRNKLGYIYRIIHNY